MKNQPKDHHYVPKFYLRYFSIPETRNLKYPKIWCQNFGNGNSIFPAGTHKIAYEKHLYSLRTDSGMDVSLENDFAEIEGLISNIWELLNSQLNDSNDLNAYKKGLSLFISIMMNRNPSQFKEWEHLHKEISNLFGSLFENTDRILYQEENKENYLDIKEFEEYKKLTKIDIKENFINLKGVIL